MAERQTFVIVGASLAGAKAAETLRAEGFDGRVLLVGEEPERPYERPPLSKGYLRGESPREKAYVHEASFYGDQEIELMTSSPARAIDPAERTVALASGERIPFDRLLLATGSAPRRLTVPGAELDGVLYLRTMADADALRAALDASARLVVIGAGWIGCEVAASARQMGLDVALVEMGAVPLERVLGAEVGGIYGQIHADHGVRVLTGAQVERLEGAERVERVRLADGTSLDCDVVAVGVGVAPRVELAEAAGLAVEHGVLVDARLESSVPGIFAAGDLAVAEHPLLGGRVWVEHWANALNQGPAAARAMLGGREGYDRIPYFFSDQYDVGMEYSGLARSWDCLVIRGDVDRREFIAFWLEGGRVGAGMNVNVWDVTEPIQALVRSGRPVDADRLADTDVPLGELAAEGEG
jgi:3-phenylpropionate/trans-cinnamate dioxygenase ferredoxin reductase component